MRRSQYNTKDFKKLNKIPLFLIVTLCAVLCVQCALADPGFFFLEGGGTGAPRAPVPYPIVKSISFFPLFCSLYFTVDSDPHEVKNLDSDPQETNTVLTVLSYVILLSLAVIFCELPAIQN